ncbi:MAG: phosphopentomutase, partial [Solirubrobacterales bacterium]|nr:phosphopentomutase [Solirubrobacterales bacterium]
MQPAGPFYSLGSGDWTPVRRAFVVVLDACGVGALPDAAEYGDTGANTLGHLAREAGGLDLPTLGRLGLGSIVDLDGVPPAEAPVLHGRLSALGPGKDSTAGHWGLMGVSTGQALPTYPEGFPDEIVEIVSAASGRGVICNRPCNGIEAIEQCGGEQLESGGLIVYTSQDSVLQIAAHIDVLDPDELYAVCAEVRSALGEDRAVGRVIARPFAGSPGEWRRTDGRRDFSIVPPGRSYLEELQDAGVEVHSVGKVGQLFAGVGIDVQHPGPTNACALAETTELIRSLPGGFVFTNLVETDQVYGHRHDVAGFHRALREIDTAVAEWLALLRAEDMLVLTADHGCDPISPRTDHTREYAPLLAWFEGQGSRRRDGSLADVGASVLAWL